jgi:hypothetical protein
VELQIHIFLTSALVPGEWTTSRSRRFIPLEISPRTHWIGGWVGPRNGLDDRDSNSDPLPIQAISTALSHVKTTVSSVFTLFFQCLIYIRETFICWSFKLQGIGTLHVEREPKSPHRRSCWRHRSHLLQGCQVHLQMFQNIQHFHGTTMGTEGSRSPRCLRSSPGISGRRKQTAFTWTGICKETAQISQSDVPSVTVHIRC